MMKNKEIRKVGDKLVNQNSFILIVSTVAIIGQLFSIGVLIWQMITNMFGFWFWFSLNATVGYGLFIGLLNDLRLMRYL